MSVSTLLPFCSSAQAKKPGSGIEQIRGYSGAAVFDHVFKRSGAAVFDRDFKRSGAAVFDRDLQRPDTATHANHEPTLRLKLGAVENRRNDRPEKVASDSRDLYFLLQQFDRDGSIAEAIRLGPAPLLPLIVSAAQRTLVDGAELLQRSLLVYSSATPQPPFADDLIFVGERLIAGLRTA